MIELRLYVHEDTGTAERVREALAAAGLRVAEPEADDAHRVVIGAEGGATDAERTVDLARRYEELERVVHELRNLDVAKSQFLANVSHELRTPLTAIVTYGEVLRDGLLGELNVRQGDAIESVISSSRQLLSMIEEILTYARTTSAAIELKAAEFDVDEAIRAVYQMNSSLIKQKELRYSATVDPEVPAAWGDRDKVIHVLGNLVGNAIQFTPTGGLLRLHVSRAPGHSDWLQVVVEDSGIGIDRVHHQMIFREFAQVDSSRARRHHGTGLGLAIARNFVQLHGGEIWVESEPGAGSRFYFTLPSTAARAGDDAGDE
jgi:two-component system, NarL family, sensor histidine kinase BarA